MSDFGRSSKVSAVKPYRCDECGTSINKGDKYLYHAGAWEGEFFVNRACLHCATLRRMVCEYDEWYWETYYGGLGEWVHNFDFSYLPERIEHRGPFARMLAGYKKRWRTAQGNPWPIFRFEEWDE